MNRLTLFALLAAFTCTALPAAANTWGDRAKPKDPTLQLIERKIDRGKRSGELTPDEVRRLNKQGRQLARLKRQAMADGILTRREYRMVRQVEKKLVEAIERESTDHERVNRRMKPKHRPGRR